MDAKHRGIQLFGWLCVVAGYGLALALIRGVLQGIMQGFRGHPHVGWLVLSYALFLATAVYLFAKGRRAIATAKGIAQPTARFGWGRILLGALVIFGHLTSHFKLLPVSRFEVRQLEYENQAQANAGYFATITIYIGCACLVVWGIWKGFRSQNHPVADLDKQQGPSSTTLEES